MLSSGLAVAATKPDDNVRTPAPEVGDWRDDWRRNRNLMIELNPALEYDPTSVMVMFVRGTSEKQKALIRDSIGGMTVETWDSFPGLEHLAIKGRVEDAVAVVSVLGEMTQLVEFVEPDFVAHLNELTNDTAFGSLWAMNNTGQVVNGDTGTAGADIDANLAWDVVTGSTSMVVGMADSGFNSTHEDLAANRWTNPGEIANNGIDDEGNGKIDDVWGWDFYNNDNNPTDDNGHGTHTAGTVGAVGSYLVLGHAQLSIVFAIAMMINSVVAGLVGVVVPVALDKANVDPAVSSAVFVTTATDVMGFLSFLGLAALWGLSG